MRGHWEKTLAIAIVLVIVASACATSAVPRPTQSVAQTQQAQTVAAAPESLASRPEDVAGVWMVTLPDNAGKANLELTKEGGYRLAGVDGRAKGATVDDGKFWFDGTQLKIQSTGRTCLDFQQKSIPNCVGIYQAYVAKQGDKPFTPRLAAVDDPGADRKRAYDGKTFPPSQP